MNELYKNKEWLKEQYINLGLSTISIAEKCNIKSPTTIHNWLTKFEIPIRNFTEMNLNRVKNGFITWNKGLKGFLDGKNHYYWKGDEAGQKAIHIWLKQHFPKPNKCNRCNKEKTLELSFNHLLKEYTRNIEDYEWLCQRCHRNRDLNELNTDWGFLKANKIKKVKNI